MAGKTKKSGSRPPTPSSGSPTMPKGLMGHLGLKSSPFAPTDCKLTSQYMVVDHMAAHYRKVNTARACVDTTPPKAWLVSQKVRDQSRRIAVKQEAKRRDQWLRATSRPGSCASSDRDREEMMAMMESFRSMDEMDVVDGHMAQEGGANTTMEVHPSETSQPSDMNSRDLRLVNRMVHDTKQAPSTYHSAKIIRSNIPANNQQTTGALLRNGTRTTTQVPRSPRTPTSADLINSQAHHFTEEKPFTPRTLKKSNVASKLSEFKYYNAPKPRSGEKHGGRHGGGAPVSAKGSLMSRPETPMTTDSMDLMNETLMSRDYSHAVRSSTGVPPLDISLDADNLHWLKEQSKKAWVRSSIRSHSDLGSEHGSLHSGRHYAGLRGAHGSGQHSLRDPHVGPCTTLQAKDRTTTMNLTGSMTVNGFHGVTREEELLYLEFVTDVTNDILDRGIFTNRVLKQVFEAHMERRKGQLKVSKMRDMLDDLRRDLGIPMMDDEDDEGMGLSSTLPSALDEPAAYSSSASLHSASRTNRRKDLESSSSPHDLPNLRPGRRTSGEGKPPLPRPGARAPVSRPGSAASFSNLQEVKEEIEESDFHTVGMATLKPQGAATLKADILKLDQEDLTEVSNDGDLTSPRERMGTEEGYDEPDKGDESTSLDLMSTVNTDGLGSTFKVDEAQQETNGSDGKNDYYGDDEENPEENVFDDTLTESRQLIAALEETHGLEASSRPRSRSHDDEAEGEELQKLLPETNSHDPPKPTPRQRKSVITPSSEHARETPRSIEQTQTSESIDVSDLDDDEDANF